MATFAKLMAESPSGDPVVAGNAGDSLIVQMMESGDMPPRGRKVPQQEIALIKTWIQQGAAFDGPDQTAPLGNGGGQGRGR